MAKLPWFRMWAEAVDDEKLRLLAFEDRWHFVALMCLKSQGVLDEQDSELRKRKICVKLGLDSVEYETVVKRLVTVGVTDLAGNPTSWNKRQFASDSSTKRVKEFRKRLRNVSVTDQIQITDTDTEKDSGSVSKSSSKKNKPKKPTLATLPEDFHLTGALRTYAEDQLADVDAVKLFVDFCEKACAKGWKYVDWSKAWQVYVRNCRQNSGHFAANNYPRKGGNRLAV
jgi:hypothetical protein